MATQTSIGNAALRMLGKPRIDSFATGGPAGQILIDIYEDKVEYLLRGHVWNFALARKSLSETTPAPTWGPDHAYALPGDFVRIVSIEGDEDRIAGRWQVEGGTIVTDYDAPLKVLYIRRADESEFDASFTECLAAMLAAEMAQALTGNLELQNELQQEAERKFRQAKGADGQEGTPPVMRRDTWVAAHNGLSARSNNPGRWGN